MSRPGDGPGRPDDWRNWDRPPAPPRKVSGGIKARSQRGSIARTWWSARFIEVLESIGVGGRLGRGRSYARAGQVMELEVGAGVVSARVQGSRSTPYRVRIALGPYGKAEWAQVEQALADDAFYAAKLLAGEMPTGIEEVFGSVGLALFPADVRELSMDCTCPDHEVPCKHLAAVFYLLAESFDADPFALLALRGRERDELLDNVRARRGGGGPARDEPDDDVVALVDCLDRFFAAGSELPAIPPSTGGSTCAVLDQLPPIGVTVRGRDLPDLLGPAYLALAEEPDTEN